VEKYRNPLIAEGESVSPKHQNYFEVLNFLHEWCWKQIVCRSL